MTAQSFDISPAFQLYALANERSSEKRLELLRRIADTFAVESKTAAPSVQYLLDELVITLLKKVNDEERAPAAESLAKMHRLPESVAQALVHDENMAVARPVIQNYRALSKDILVELASKGSQVHLEAIAGRDALEHEITDIVVQRGNEEVVRTLAANKGAQFSRLGMRTMIGRAGNDERLQVLLTERCDLSLEAVGQLLPLLSQHLAEKLRSTSLSFNATVVHDHVFSWLSGRQRNIARANRSIERIRNGAEKLDHALMMEIEERLLLNAATLIAGVSELDRDFAFNLVTQGSSDNLVVLLRSLAVGWPVADSLLKLRQDKLGAQICGPKVDQIAYEAVDVAGAQRVMRFVKVRRTAIAQEKEAIAS